MNCFVLLYIALPSATACLGINLLRNRIAQTISENLGTYWWGSTYAWCKTILKPPSNILYYPILTDQLLNLMHHSEKSRVSIFKLIGYSRCSNQLFGKNLFMIIGYQVQFEELYVWSSCLILRTGELLTFNLRTCICYSLAVQYAFLDNKNNYKTIGTSS
jgi:hypothetical protein